MDEVFPLLYYWAWRVLSAARRSRPYRAGPALSGCWNAGPGWRTRIREAGHIPASKREEELLPPVDRRLLQQYMYFLRFLRDESSHEGPG